VQADFTHEAGLIVRLAAFDIPFFHGSAVINYVTAALYGPTTIAVFPPQAAKPGALPIIATAENIIEHAERTKATALFSALRFISNFARSEKAISVLRSMAFVVSPSHLVTS
jgi:hypothetical protein